MTPMIACWMALSFIGLIKIAPEAVSIGSAAAKSGRNLAQAAGGNIFFDGIDSASVAVMQKARQDIEKNRKGDFTILFVDQKGRPIHAEAEISLKHHEFQFGANLNLVAATKDTLLQQKAFDIVDELFSTVRVGNNWRDLEPTKGHPPDWKFTDSLINWARAHDKHMRFHCLIFNSPAAMPDWAPKIKTDTEWWLLIERRIATVAQKYGNLIAEYDVINEVISRSRWIKNTNPNFPDLAVPANAKRVFELAEKYLPDARLVILDYLIATKANRLFDRLNTYYDNLLKMGAPIDVIGYQGHYYSDGQTPFHRGHRYLGPDAFTMRSINAEFENLARFAKPIHITEFNAPSRKKQWGVSQPLLTDDEIAAWEINYYTLAFSKPYIHQLVRWHIIDGWRDGLDAGFLKLDGTVKPNYYAIRKLLKHTWSTHWQGALDNGMAFFRGFYGTYRAQVNGYPSVEFTINSSDKEKKKIIPLPEA